MASVTSITITSVGYREFQQPAPDLKIEGTFTLSDAGSFLPAGYVAYALEETAAGTTRSLLGPVSFVRMPNEAWGFFKLEAKTPALWLAHIQSGDTITFVIHNTMTHADVVTLDPITICFYPGTMIATPSGETAVETLAIGDLVLRQDGTSAPIRWIGRNSIALPFANKMKALPIRIRKDALDENVPCRDLLVSPDHALLVDGNLIQAGALVNGASVIRETDVPIAFTYYHIELADHALVIAENTPAETFIDNVDRMNFDNWPEHEALYGDEPVLVEMDLPRAKSQRQVPAATRNRLAARAVDLGYAARTADAA